MGSSSSLINLPDDIGRGLDIAAGEARKMPSEIVLEALDQSEVNAREDQFQKRMTSFAASVGPRLSINSRLSVWTSCRARYLRT